jgi:hypothetical protein
VDACTHVIVVVGVVVGVVGGVVGVGVDGSASVVGGVGFVVVVVVYGVWAQLGFKVLCDDGCACVMPV